MSRVPDEFLIGCGSVEPWWMGRTIVKWSTDWQWPAVRIAISLVPSESNSYKRCVRYPAARIFDQVDHKVSRARVEYVGLTVNLSDVVAIVIDVGLLGPNALERDSAHGFLLMVWR